MCHGEMGIQIMRRCGKAAQDPGGLLAVQRDGGRGAGAACLIGDGALNPYKHPLVRGMELTTEERQGLYDFLLALTDDDFLTDPALSDPWAQ
jgi:hypothetical protein